MGFFLRDIKNCGTPVALPVEPLGTTNARWPTRAKELRLFYVSTRQLAGFQRLGGAARGSEDDLAGVHGYEPPTGERPASRFRCSRNNRNSFACGGSDAPAQRTNAGGSCAVWVCRGDRICRPGSVPQISYRYLSPVLTLRVGRISIFFKDLRVPICEGGLSGRQASSFSSG